MGVEEGRVVSNLPLPKDGGGLCLRDGGINAGRLSQVGSVERILVEEGPKKRV